MACLIRRLLGGFGLWFCFVAPASAAVAVVQCTSATALGTCVATTTNACTTNAVLPSAPSASNLVIVWAHNDAGGLTSVSIPAPSGFTAGPNLFATATTTNDLETASFYRTGTTATSFSVTFNATTSGSQYFGAAAACEISGANNTSPTNASGTGSFVIVTNVGQTGTGAGPVTPTTSGTLALSLWGWNDDGHDTYGNTVQSGWTANFNNSVVQTNYAALYAASLASPTSGVGLTSTLNLTAGASYVSPIWMNLLWIINPAGFPAASSFSVYPYEGAYPGGMPP